MTKLEYALKEAEKLPPEMQEQLGENLLHAIHKWLALQDDLAIGIAQLDAGEVVDWEDVLADLKSRYGA